MTDSTSTPSSTHGPVDVISPNADQHQIVIIGGGAGGLELATRLGDQFGTTGKAAISLIEMSRTHFWKPHLHEIAAGSMDLGTYELNHLAQSYWHGYRYRFGEVVAIDREQRKVPIRFATLLADNTDARAAAAMNALEKVKTGLKFVPVSRSDMNSDVETTHHALQPYSNTKHH